MSEKPGHAQSASEAFIAEVNGWKLAGVVVWHAGLFILGAAAWSLPPSLSPRALLSALFFSSSWFYLLLIYGSLAGVLYAQRRVLTTIDVPPLYVAKLGWSSKSWPALLLSRCGCVSVLVCGCWLVDKWWWWWWWVGGGLWLAGWNVVTAVCRRQLQAIGHQRDLLCCCPFPLLPPLLCCCCCKHKHKQVRAAPAHPGVCGRRAAVVC